MSHPTPADLLELHFGEREGERHVSFAAHVEGCPGCRAFLAEIESLERVLAPRPADAPPVDGLDRVLRRVEGLRPARERRNRGRWAVRAVLPSFAAAAGAVVAVHHGGLVVAVALFAAGTLVTLALAPVLILESQRRSS